MYAERKQTKHTHTYINTERERKQLEKKDNTLLDLEKDYTLHELDVYNFFNLKSLLSNSGYVRVCFMLVFKSMTILFMTS